MSLYPLKYLICEKKDNQIFTHKTEIFLTDAPKCLISGDSFDVDNLKNFIDICSQEITLQCLSIRLKKIIDKYNSCNNSRKKSNLRTKIIQLYSTIIEYENDDDTVETDDCDNCDDDNDELLYDEKLDKYYLNYNIDYDFDDIDDLIEINKIYESFLIKLEKINKENFFIKVMW